MRTIFFFIVLSLLLTSCNNALKKEYDPSTLNSDLQEIRQQEKASDEDIQLLTKYIILARINGVHLEDESYQDILDKLKEAKKSLSD